MATPHGFWSNAVGDALRAAQGVGRAMQRCRSPVHLLLLVAIVIFVTGMNVLFYLVRMLPPAVLGEALVDALLPTVLILPVVYAFMWCPRALHISRREQAEAAHQRSEVSCQQLTENIHEVFWVSSADLSQLMYVSPAYEKVWGRSCDSLYTAPASFLDSVYPEDRERLITAVSTQGYGEFAEEYRIVRPSGEVRWIRVRAFPIRNERAEVHRIAGFAEDITECKQAEETLCAYQMQLQSLVSELLLTKERERRALATDLHDSIGQLLAIARFKLSALQGVDDVCELIDQAIQQMRSLIFELSPPVLYLVGLVAAVESLAQHMQARYGLGIEVSHDDEYQTLTEDMQILLFRAVQELLMNVVKHAQAQHVQITISRDGEYLRIAVADDGVGFDLSRSSRSREGPASGFGLFSISKRLQSLHGYCEIDSKPGHGTQVTLMALLPCTEATPQSGLV